MSTLAILANIATGALLVEIGRWLERRRLLYLAEDNLRTIARLNGECDANSRLIHKLFDLLGNELRGGKRP